MKLENNILPLLVLRDVTVFPKTVAPIFIGRKKSLNALEAVKDIEKQDTILLTTQKSTDIENPKVGDLYNIGVIAKIIQTIKLPNNNAKILVEAVERVKLIDIEDGEYFRSHYETVLDTKIKNKSELEFSIKSLVNAFQDYVRINKKINLDVLNILNNQKDPAYITNIIASHISIEPEIKQQLLEEKSIIKRTEALLDITIAENTQIDIEQQIQQRVKKQIEKTQREFYLNEQMKAIQHEMDDGKSKSEFKDLENKIKKLGLSKDAKEKAETELKRLKMMNPMSAESTGVRTYLETLLGLPWGKKTSKKIEIQHAEEILNRDHYGLEKVKERIIEYLSVLKRSTKVRGPILCLIGPPGVGKTSLVKSIAEAMERKYIKFALGGVKDEAEVRGHRRTYIGSMTGKIISSIKKVKYDNPVMLLDEIDKMSADFRGDPASALLEVLDPEQNSQFSDHYLEVDYDLSNVVFIATANSYNLPRPLLDRMEIIDIAGYIEEEKLEIAKRHLLKKQLKMHGLKKNELIIPDKTIIELIRYYTKESGVRSLEREIGALARKVLTKILKNKDIKSVTIEPKNIEEYLGVKKYSFGLAEEKNQIGVTTGLAYTSVGGDLLSIEASCFKDKGSIQSTGKLGDVMKESVQAAYSCFLSNAESFGLKSQDYKEYSIHVHVPEGATPKDGPSAGIAIYTTIVSLMTKKPVSKDVAMTGEITLRGRVLPIGGLKEKLLAARRGGIKKVLIPKENIKDLKEVPDNIKNNLDIIPVEHIKEVVKHALVG